MDLIKALIKAAILVIVLYACYIRIINDIADACYGK